VSAPTLSPPARAGGAGSSARTGGAHRPPSRPPALRRAGHHREDAAQFEKLGINCEETYKVEGYETSETIVKSFGLQWET
jgi:hypothetical protein